MTTNRNLYYDLQEQLAFLEASCSSFDAGMEIEAKRLAVTIRVLVHDTGASTSLLNQLGVKDQLQWISSGAVDPRNLISTNSLTSMRIESTGDGASSMSYAPHDFDTIKQFGRLVDFDLWWTQAVIKDTHGEEFSRKDLVLVLANKDGGAHIDRVQARVRRLASEGSLGWLFGPAPAEGDEISLQGELITLSPILASVRTIAEELRVSLVSQQALLSPNS